MIAFGRASKKLINRLETIQRKGLRLVFNLKRHDNVDKYMSSHKILSISKCYEMLSCAWGARVLKGEAPLGVSKMFDVLGSERSKSFKIQSLSK